VVAAVTSGAITLEEVCQRYSVSKEEFQSWRDLLQRHGMYGLRTTRSQIYRSLDEREGEAG
jgi:transposase-like protein